MLLTGGIRKSSGSHHGVPLAEKCAVDLQPPPAGSHHGGVWEHCIHTIRKVMRALLREQVLDDKMPATLMCEVESIVNGRPLTKVSDDPKRF